MRAILIIALVIFLLNALLLMGVVGYGLATGKFNAQKRQQYLATWKGQLLVAPPEEKKEEKEVESPQQASAKIESREVEKEITSREIQRELEVLKNMQFTLNAFQGKLEEQRLKLDDEKNQFKKILQQQQVAAEREGFLKALKAYSQMKPKYVKNDFMKMEDNEVVRYLAEMKPDTVTSILNQFKTPEEQEKRIRIMELLQKQKVIKFDPKNNQEKLAS